MSVANQSQRAAPNPWDIGFGAVVLAASTAALLFWFPNDIKGGFIETGIGGKPEPGDAFFPVLLGIALLGLSVVHLVVTILGRAPRSPFLDESAGRLTPGNLSFFFLFHAIVVAGLAIMYWLGPLTVQALNAFGTIDVGYRQLVDTAPYKYLGYLVGGFLMTITLITWAEGGLRRRAVFTAALVLAVLVLIFDILLTNIQLPPNANY